MKLKWAEGHCRFEQVPFRRVFEQVRRVVPANAEIVTAYTDGQVTLRSNRSKIGYHEAADLSGYQGVVSGDFVVHGLDILRGSVGVSDAAGAISSVCTICRPRIDCDPRYFAYAMRAQAMTGLPRALAKGVREGGADFRRWETLAELPLPLPSPSAQRAIADFLDPEVARIDALITKKRRLIELVDQRWRVAVREQMVRLTEEVGSIQLRHLVRCLDGRRVPLSSEEREHRSGSFPYYGASGIVDWIDGYLFDETLVLLGEDGAQLGDPGYPIAQVVTGKVWVNNHAHVLRPIRTDPEFLALHLNTFDRVPVMSGGTREKITQDDMNRIRVPDLSRAEQQSQAQRLCVIRQRCDSMGQRLASQIDLLVERRQALITAAVTGELAVPGAP